MRTRIIRIAVIAVCVAGVAGMIVASVTNHNGAAITFGLVTAVAILCQMVATTVANEAGRAPGAPGASDEAQADEAQADEAQADEAQAADLEARIDALVDGGADEAAVRDLVRHAVSLGRRRSTAPAPPDS